MGCNGDTALTAILSVVRSIHISLGLLGLTQMINTQNPCMNCTHSSFSCTHTQCQTPGTDGREIFRRYTCYRNLQSQATQSGLITEDGESLHTYCIPTFQLRWTNHFPLCNGCYVTFEEPFAGPARTLPTFIRQARPQIHRNSESPLRVHATHDLTAFAFILAVHNSSDFDAAFYLGASR